MIFIFKLAICDDSPEDLNYINELINIILSDNAIKYTIQSFNSYNDLLSNYEQNRPNWDLVILDILLADKNGVDLGIRLRSLGYKGFLIYVSTSKDFALPAIDTDVTRYLIKPVSYEKLKDGILWCYKRREVSDEVIFETKSQIWKFNVEDIYYCESVNRGVCIYLHNRKIYIPIIISKMKGMMLQHNFCVPHYSFIVNIKKITHIKRYELTLDNGCVVPISKNAYNSIRNLFLNQMMASF